MEKYEIFYSENYQIKFFPPWLVRAPLLRPLTNNCFALVDVPSARAVVGVCSPTTEAQAICSSESYPPPPTPADKPNQIFKQQFFFEVNERDKSLQVDAPSPLRGTEHEPSSISISNQSPQMKKTLSVGDCFVAFRMRPTLHSSQ